MKFVLLSMVVVPAPLRQIQNRGDGAERVGQGHRRATLQHGWACAELVAHPHFGSHPVRRRLQHLNTRQLGERQRGCHDSRLQLRAKRGVRAQRSVA